MDKLPQTGFRDAVPTNVEHAPLRLLERPLSLLQPARALPRPAPAWRVRLDRLAELILLAR